YVGRKRLISRQTLGHVSWSSHLHAVRVLVVAAVLVAGCGARTGLRTSSDAATSASLVDGIALRTCAPNDAPALSFSLSSSPVPTCQVPGIGAGVIILVWDPMP